MLLCPPEDTQGGTENSTDCFSVWGGGIFDKLGWFLQYLLKPLLKSVPAHLNNTAELVSKIHAIDTEDLKGLVPVKFDVVSLYTNVNTNEAIDTALEYCRRSRIYLYGLCLEDIWELLHLLPANNVFEYEGLFYQQIRGLAMGNRLSGTLAIICMDRLERKFVYSLKPKPIFFTFVMSMMLAPWYPTRRAQ